MKWVLIILGALVVLMAVVWAIGAALPREHTATRIARYKQPPEKIWAAITEIDAFPQWRKDMKSVKRMAERDDKPAWVETLSMGEMPLRVQEWSAPVRMVVRIDTDDLPFGGAWIYEIAPAEGGATLRITENGFVKPPLFRFMSRYVFGYASTLEQYLKDLGKKFGEEATPQP